MREEDYKAIRCNYAEGTNIASTGATAYVLHMNYGNANDRLHVLVRSRGGRWVEKWESTKRLTNFRVTTIPPGHPLYGRVGYPETNAEITEKDCAVLVALQETEHKR